MSRWHDASANVDTVPLPPSISTSPFDVLKYQDVEDRRRGHSE
jgi:hypothetical protein